MLHGQRPSAGQVVVSHHQQALLQIADHSESNVRSELGGVLLGHVYREGETLFVDVHAALPANSNERGPVHFTFTADAWSQIHRDKAAHYPRLDIVGWFHTHPGLGVFYSSDDVVVHSAAFTLPWHVGLVVDPVRREAAYFGWLQGSLAPIGGYYELADQQPHSVVDWQAVRTSVYHLPEAEIAEGVWGETDAPTPYPNVAYVPDQEWRTLSPSSRHLGLIIGSVALALALFLLAFWIVPLNQRAVQMEKVMLGLANTAANPNVHTCPDSRLRLLSPLNGSVAQVGSQVEMIGTAVYPEAFRYQVTARPAGQEEWAEIGSRRRGSQLDALAIWRTTSVQPGTYEVRLTAVDRNGIRLPNSPDCLVQMQLVP